MKQQNVVVARAILALVYLAAQACAEKRAAPSSQEPPVPAAEATAPAAGAPLRKAAPASADTLRNAAGSGAEQDPDLQPPPARMVHYDGHVKLKVTTPSEALEGAAKLAEKLGGYVESQSERVVSLRVPVAAVRSLFQALQGLGDVLERSLTAQDVTDAFVALELREKTLTASRDRLLTLLAHTGDEDEKLQLLREIQRLTETIDQLHMQAQTMAKLASYSRITLEVVPRQAYSSAEPEEVAAFRWISRLSPFRREVARSGDYLELAVPEGMVLLDARDTFIAESADGAVLWASTRDNEPRGDTQFWLDAVKARLGRDYGEAQLFEVGGFKVARFVDAEPGYRYWIGVRARGDELDVLEAYYPTAAHEERFGERIKQALKKGAS